MKPSYSRPYIFIEKIAIKICALAEGSAIKLMKTFSPRPYFFMPKITARIFVLAAGSDPRVSARHERLGSR